MRASTKKFAEVIFSSRAAVFPLLREMAKPDLVGRISDIRFPSEPSLDLRRVFKA